MEVSNFVKRIQDIMRQDSGVDGDAQRIHQMTWLFFLKAYDAKEDEWEIEDNSYKSLLPDDLRWKNWAIDDKSNKVKTGDELITFIEDYLFKYLKDLYINENTPLKQRILKYVFEDTKNYMKDGTSLRKVINIINEINFSEYKERHNFGDIYETILKGLQSAGNAGEFYTPRAVTDFIVNFIKPNLGEKVADFACGTGGFLTSTLKYLENKKQSEQDIISYNNSVYGIEKKHMPYLLCITNMLIHDVDEPKIYHRNSLEKNIRDYKEDEKFDIILMNPPYGGAESDLIKQNFPTDLRSSETADLFISLIMYRLKEKGRAAVIIPDGFLFGEDNAKIAIKKKLTKEFNLHTIIRLPHSVFSPYTSITTNILFFDKSKPTEKIWIYRMDMPKGYKHFSKTKPILYEHFDPVFNWINEKKEIIENDFPKAKEYNIKEIEERNYNLDLCGVPHVEEEILEPKELITQFMKKRQEYNDEMNSLLKQILEIIDEDI